MSSIDEDRFEDRVEELQERSRLSEPEARITAALEQGLSADEVGELFDIPASTVEEYTERIRQTVHEARVLVEEIGDVYDEPE